MTRRGFTLVETLVTLAVFGLFLTGLLQAERSYRTALAEEDHALRVQQVQAAVELLRAELGRAGYGSEGADLWVERYASSDRVTVRYLEDRIAGEAVLKLVGYDAGRDGRGLASLYRKEGTANRQPAVLGAVELRVLGFLDDAGAEVDAPTERVMGVRLALQWSWGERTTFTVGFPNKVAYGPVSP